MRGFPIRGGLCALVSVAMSTLAGAQTPLGTSFRYQGQLADGGVPSSGAHDLRFRLFDAATGGNEVGSIICADNVAVADGRFVVLLDFGAVFAGNQRFLEIEVRRDTGVGCSSVGGFTVLGPRQELTATPNALFARTATTATSALSATSAMNATRLDGQPSDFYRNAANLTGTISDARLPLNVARLDRMQTFTGQTSFQGITTFFGQTTMTNPQNSFTGSFNGSGAGLMNLNGARIQAGTVPRSAMRADVQAGLATQVPDWNATPLGGGGFATIGASPKGVAVSGSHAYVVNSASSTLEVFSIGESGGPTLVGSAAIGGTPSSVVVSGTRLIVVHSNPNALQVFDVAVPSAPVAAGSIGMPGRPRAVAASGSFAYVVCEISNTLEIFNIANPGGPALVGSISTGGSPSSIAVYGGFVCIANSGSNAFQVFNVSNPAAPSLFGSVGTGLSPSSVAVSGVHAYVGVTSPEGLQVIDLFDPANPTLVGSVSTIGVPISVASVDGFVFSASNDGFEVFNTVDPRSPVRVTGVSFEGDLRSVAVTDGYAAVVTSEPNRIELLTPPRRTGFATAIASSSLHGVDGSGLTNLNGSMIRGTIYDDRLSSNVARLDRSQVFTGQMFFSDPSNTFRGNFVGNGSMLFDLNGANLMTGSVPRSALSQDVQRGLGTALSDWSLTPYRFEAAAAAGDRPGAFAIEGTWGYVLDKALFGSPIGDRVLVYDVSNSPSAPVQIGTVEIGRTESLDLQVQGSFVYVSFRFAGGIDVFDVRNPASPVWVSNLNPEFSGGPFVLEGTRAYVGNDRAFANDSVLIYDVSNPALPALLGSVAVPGFQIMSVSASGTSLFVSVRVHESQDFFSTFIYDVADPSQPVLASVFPLADCIRIDVSNPAVAVRWIDLAGSFLRM